SPGRHQSNDALLLEAVAERLRARGGEVDITTIDRRMEAPDAAVVFSMCQGRSALERLIAWERDGVPIVNSPRAALNTYRDRLPGLMLKAGIPFPETELISTNGHGGHTAIDTKRLARRGVWLKRGDVHASVSRDVQWIDSAGAFEAGCAEFRARGIAAA